MRVIAGKYRGIKLDSIEDRALRPMLDRVKESLFNILQMSTADAVVLDLFSGSGAIGIEALSRGACFCFFVERSRKLAELIRNNLDKCAVNSESADVIRCDVKSLTERESPGDRATPNMVFVDPPYAMTDDVHRRTELFELLEAIIGKWIADEALIVVHHAPAPYILWPTKRLHCYDQRIYGRSQLSFFNVGLD